MISSPLSRLLANQVNGMCRRKETRDGDKWGEKRRRWGHEEEVGGWEMKERAAIVRLVSGGVKWEALSLQDKETSVEESKKKNSEIHTANLRWYLKTGDQNKKKKVKKWAERSLHNNRWTTKTCLNSCNQTELRSTSFLKVVPSEERLRQKRRSDQRHRRRLKMKI